MSAPANSVHELSDVGNASVGMEIIISVAQSHFSRPICDLSDYWGYYKTQLLRRLAAHAAYLRDLTHKFAFLRRIDWRDPHIKFVCLEQRRQNQYQRVRMSKVFKSNGGSCFSDSWAYFEDALRSEPVRSSIQTSDYFAIVLPSPRPIDLFLSFNAQCLSIHEEKMQANLGTRRVRNLVIEPLQLPYQAGANQHHFDRESLSEDSPPKRVFCLPIQADAHSTIFLGARRETEEPEFVDWLTLLDQFCSVQNQRDSSYAEIGLARREEILEDAFSVLYHSRLIAPERETTEKQTSLQDCAMTLADHLHYPVFFRDTKRLLAYAIHFPTVTKIFVKNGLTSSVACSSISHEIGHCRLNHRPVSEFGLDVKRLSESQRFVFAYQEWEANLFADDVIQLLKHFSRSSLSDCANDEDTSTSSLLDEVWAMHFWDFLESGVEQDRVYSRQSESCAEALSESSQNEKKEQDLNVKAAARVGFNSATQGLMFDSAPAQNADLKPVNSASPMFFWNYFIRENDATPS